MKIIFDGNEKVSLPIVEENQERSQEGQKNLQEKQPTRRVKERKGFRCSFCFLKLKSKDGKARHELLHAGQKFNCRTCNIEFKRLDYLMKHKQRPIHLARVGRKSKSGGKIEGQEDKVTCEVCHWSFTNADSLERHMKSHRSQLVQPSSSFDSISATNVSSSNDESHLVEKASNIAIVKAVPIEVVQAKTSGFTSLKIQKCTCEYCGKVFTNPYRLKTHMYSHDSKPQFQCKLCPKRYFQPAGVSNHMRQKHFQQ